MKRILSLLILLCLLFTFAACSREENPVRFYYLRNEVRFESKEGVVVAEDRESLSRDNSLSYLLSLYLEGPIDPELSLPLPEGTKIQNILVDEDTLILIMSREFTQLSGMDLTLVSTCIASTCFDLTNANKITFATQGKNGEDPFSFSLTRDSIILEDTVTSTTVETTSE